MFSKQPPRCPQCQGPTSLAADNPFRPFCCERCKLLDFGAWAEGRYGIAADEDPSAESDDELRLQ